LHFAVSPTGNYNSATLADSKMAIDMAGNVGIGITAPAARLHHPACAAGANLASLKIDPGTVPTTPVSGEIYSDGTHVYWVDSGGTQRQLDN
jgi:hypothetical protein